MTDGVKLRVIDIVRETDRALLLRFESGLEAWFPKSHILETEGDTITVSEWIARAKGLIDEEGVRTSVTERVDCQSAVAVAQDAWLQAGGCTRCWGTSLIVGIAGAELESCFCDGKRRELLRWAPDMPYSWRQFFIATCRVGWQ